MLWFVLTRAVPRCYNRLCSGLLAYHPILTFPRIGLTHEMQFTRIDIFSNEKGNEPFTKWVDNLDSTVRGKVNTRLDRVLLGDFTNTKHIGDKVMVLSYRDGMRLYYTTKANAIVLLCGGNKSSQKQDIKNAKQHAKDFHSWHV